ncbi:Uncharacterized protein DBV15_08367 [Temnothorax longispinosus]|uniref:Uncharacterized protein n=1 Tax=Temnothorax longispinosus TaxID=300112 RepID=A0A4S2KBP8_9HYME|nr:Uncharacterized protein DBV15_08367 [Temnothorax longispinosus]
MQARAIQVAAGNPALSSLTPERGPHATLLGNTLFISHFIVYGLRQKGASNALFRDRRWLFVAYRSRGLLTRLYRSKSRISQSYQRYPGSPAGCYTGSFVYRYRGRGQANVAGHYAILAKGFRDGTPGIEHRG